jgi:hypothetical protein
MKDFVRDFDEDDGSEIAVVAVNAIGRAIKSKHNYFVLGAHIIVNEVEGGLSYGVCEHETVADLGNCGDDERAARSAALLALAVQYFTSIMFHHLDEDERKRVGRVVLESTDGILRSEYGAGLKEMLGVK